MSVCKHGTILELCSICGYKQPPEQESDESRIEHTTNGIQLCTFVLTAKDGGQSVCYEGDADYEAIEALQQRIQQLESDKKALIGGAIKEAAYIVRERFGIAERDIDQERLKEKFADCAVRLRDLTRTKRRGEAK